MIPSERRKSMIAVCGAGQCDGATATLAELVGRGVADAGATLVCGGLGGVMAAACRGARGAGGITVGILPGTDIRAANADVLVPVATGLGEARNVIIVTSADVVIAIGGEYGTLSEIALARKLGRPVIGLRTWGLGSDAAGEPHLLVVDSPEAAVAAALTHCTRR